ncbi:adenosine deaminase [Microthyrium microscopicum]|uniref:Adenine deaminase n=1 Tax=Microthyrium microscopicum TaxID=703497 RepID=A0A6A6UK81_9PEZI|nr:adenosine deaminase [Microthyrium microscopicum]
MCKSALHPLICALPKVEQHIHLEGALEPDLLFSLAAKHGIKLLADDAAFTSEQALRDRYLRFTSLDDFLGYYYIGMSVLRESVDFCELAWRYFQRAAKDGVRHAEVFFDPQAHLSRGIDYNTMLQGFVDAKKRAEDELHMSVNIIACFLRHLPVADSLAVFDNADVQASFRDGRVVGIGLDSSENDFPPVMFKEIYDKARDLNVRRTAHAGEEGPAQNIASALDNLGCQRIDHGLRLAEDPVLMKRVADEGFLLTLCPVSNILLRCVPSMKEVPIRKFLDAGVKFSLNSDDPAYFGAYILDTYCAVQEAHNLSVKDWETICTNGIQGSWCSDERKNELMGELRTVISQH